ncbi:MAG: alcohol dehydrogenase catalytic domain-containing protein [candidate division KSB1 bacterium]|nr:alcohol dehydrogenase catalytic domain-containing protein [candidate division KSB1 bacterium]MDQ7063128.1 alcohol dehydrogenase catalytic domain-containing protein [candidate division KSB1 bacterium]
MKALYFDGSLTLGERPMPQPQPGEALIRMRMAGICNTDIEITRGYMGFTGILGHEFVGEVVECDDPGWLGKRVVGEINLGCGECDYCRQNLQRHCPNRTVLGIFNKDGAMAEFLTLPVDNLYEIPASVPDREAVFTEPLAAACEIAEQLHLPPGLPTLVIGDGKLGLLIVQVLKQFGCDVTLLGRHSEKLALAESLSIRTTASADDLPAQAFDLVVEATGAPKAFETAIAKTRPRGRLVLKSTYAGGIQTDLAPLVIHEIELIGSRCGPFRPALRLLAEKRVEVMRMIHAEFPLSDGLAAFEAAQKTGVLKVLIRNDESNR